MNRIQFKKINKDNVEELCEVIATYHDDNTNKDFIIYTNGKYTESNKLMLYYSLYKYIDNNIELINIETSEDKKIGLLLIQELIKDINN